MSSGKIMKNYIHGINVSCGAKIVTKTQHLSKRQGNIIFLQYYLWFVSVVVSFLKKKLFSAEEWNKNMKKYNNNK